MSHIQKSITRAPLLSSVWGPLDGQLGPSIQQSQPKPSACMHACRQCIFIIWGKSFGFRARTLVLYHLMFHPARRKDELPRIFQCRIRARATGTILLRKLPGHPSKVGKTLLIILHQMRIMVQRVHPVRRRRLPTSCPSTPSVRRLWLKLHTVRLPANGYWSRSPLMGWYCHGGTTKHVISVNVALVVP